MTERLLYGLLCAWAGKLIELDFAGVPDMHKYKVGDTLDLLPNRGSSTRKAGECQVVALLPYEGHAVQYKVQARAESHLRIVSENDLRPGQAAALAGGASG